MKLFKYHTTAMGSRSISTSTIGLLLLAVVGFALAFAGSARSAQATVNLAQADSFGALSATAMTNAGGDTVIIGNIGSSSAIDGGVTNPGFGRFGPTNYELVNAQASLLNAYNFAEAQTPTGDITSLNLAGRTLLPGVYNSTSAILISGPTALTLDGNGDPNSVFIFQAASDGDLTVDPTSSVTFTNGAQPCNVFWKVQSAFLQNSGSTFVGTILALTSITLTDNITVQGRTLARNGDVTFIHDTVIRPSCAAAPAPPPATTAAPAATTTSPATTTTTPVTTTTPATTTTTPATTTTTPTTTTTTPAKPGAVKGKTKTRGHARPARRHFGFTG